MSRRLVVRVAAALTGLLALLIGGLVVLVLATSAPALPPPPLPTATAQPGPRSTPLLVASPLPTAPPLPTATALPGLLALPGIRSGVGADPNGAIRALATADLTNGVASTNVRYEDGAHPDIPHPACGPAGRWMLQVDPENVVGYPYSRPPSAADWTRAADVVGMATSLCPAPVALSWFAHDPSHPSSDRWAALLPPELASGLDGPALQRYALAHERQSGVDSR